jgi:transglutaminase-like putative cysteine protease
MASPRVRQAGIIPLPVAIERYLQVALYLLVLTGFGTLASTGTLDATTVLLVGAALLVRGYLLSKRKNVEIPPQWTTYLTVAYAPFYVLDLMALSQGFLPATVHLVLFGMVVRMFSARKDRDYAFLAALAFVMVLASAILTVDSAFLLAFAAFLLMAVVTFVLMEMRKSSQAATITARESGDPQAYRKMAFSLAGLAPVLVGLTLLGGAGIFFVLPRMSTGYLGGFSGGTDLSTGFSDTVRLGKIGQIQQSNAVVMHIQIQGDQQGQYDLKWRGVALSRFDGKSWTNPSEHYTLAPQPDGRFALWRAAPRSPAPKMIHYRVLMEPIGTNVFFLASRPRFLKGRYGLVSTDRTGSIFDLDSEHPVTLYDADSDIAEPTREQLREAEGAFPAELQKMYLQLPEPDALDARVPQLARQITAQATNNYEKAALIEQYLMTRYQYTLQLPRTEPKDPLANFLFERRQGHCEYFASSMAVMLRTLGIPSRVVNGFRTTEFNDVTSSYVVRASSAHSWVEANFPGYGWVGFDPTPAAAATEHGPWSRMMLYLDAAASFWREWVVNYDASHQRALGQDALRGTRTMAEQVRMWARKQYAAMLRRARQANLAMSKSPGRWTAIGMGAGLLLLLLINLRAVLAWMRARRLAAHPEEAPGEAAALWYMRLTGKLARKGLRKSESQTAREFVDAIEVQPLRTRVEKFTDAYEAARFGGSAGEASRLPELYEEVVAGEKER